MTIRRSLAAMLCLVCVLVVGAPLLTAQEKGTALPEKPSAAPEQAEKKEVQGYTLTPEKLQKAIELSRARNWLYFIDVAYGLLILLLVLRFRLAPKYRDLAERASARRFLQVIIFLPLFVLTVDIIGLPTAIYGQHLSLKYEQSVQSWGSWFGDWGKGELIGLIIFTFLFWIMYGVIRRSPRRWWLYFWMATMPIIVAVLFISPLVIDPLFFKFTPLENTQPQLVSEIEKVVKRGGLEIPRERMFESNASTKYKTVNAYVTGIGASKRVVVWDTTIQKMNRPQALFVFGHEMGHYVLGHIRNAILFIAGLLFVFYYIGYRGMKWAVARWGPAWSIRGVDDWASLPIFMLILAVLFFLASPVFTGFSRWQEHNADIYGLEVTHGLTPDSPEVAGQAFQILGEISLSDPDPHPFIKYWRYTHPPVAERVMFSRSYDPWSKGEQPKYVK